MNGDGFMVYRLDITYHLQVPQRYEVRLSVCDMEGEGSFPLYVIMISNDREVESISRFPWGLEIPFMYKNQVGEQMIMSAIAVIESLPDDAIMSRAQRQLSHFQDLIQNHRTDKNETGPINNWFDEIDWSCLKRQGWQLDYVEDTEILFEHLTTHLEDQFCSN
jgi:hypothetical protein